MYFKSNPFLSNFVSISVQYKTENDSAVARKRSELTTRTSQHVQSSNGNNNSNNSNPLAVATAANESVTNESGSLTPNDALIGSAVSKNAEELSNGSESPMTTAPTDRAMPFQSPTMPPSPVVATASVAPKEGWTDVLQNSTNYFWGNKEGLHFSTDLSMDAVNARLSIRVTLIDPSQQCPFPSFRSRLSGTSMVHIVLDNPDYRGRGVSGRTNASEAVLTGSVWIPVPGLYFLDILLVHCTMDAYNASVTSEELKTKCPVTLDIRRGIQDYNFTVKPFQRSQETVDGWVAESPSPFEYRAWVFAPRCNNTLYQVGADCTAASTDKPKMIRQRVQLPDYLSYMGFPPRPRYYSNLREQYDNYVYLPVNRSNGSIDHEADHSVPQYAGPIRKISNETFGEGKKICFIGDSFARYMLFEIKQMLSNTTYGTNAWSNLYQHDKSITKNSPHIRIEANYGTELHPKPAVLMEKRLSQCVAVFVTFGRWNARGDYHPPTTAAVYKDAVLMLLRLIEDYTPPDVKSYYLSISPMALGNDPLYCRNFRVPPLMDAYNDYVLESTIPSEGGLPLFQNLSRSFFLDNTELTEPLWDDPEDFSHPARHVFRPLDRRLLELVARDLEHMNRTIISR